MQTQGSNRFSVLVIDDDPAITAMVRRNLEDKDTRVVEAATGLEGIRVLGESKIDLVLLDLKLPDFSGWSILSLLRLTEPLQNMPVIIVSVDPVETVLVDQYKPDDYIQKPFDMSELLVRVRKFMAPKDTRQYLTGKTS